MPGRALIVGDLNGERSFGHRRGLSTLGNRTFITAMDGEALREVPWNFIPRPGNLNRLRWVTFKKDGHLDLVINGIFFGFDKPNGPDVYLGHGLGGAVEALLDRVKGVQTSLGGRRAREISIGTVISIL